MQASRDQAQADREPTHIAMVYSTPLSVIQFASPCLFLLLASGCLLADVTVDLRHDQQGVCMAGLVVPNISVVVVLYN